MCKQQVLLFKWSYLIHDNENLTENEKSRTDVGLDMDTNILNMKWVSQYDDGFMY